MNRHSCERSVKENVIWSLQRLQSWTECFIIEKDKSPKCFHLLFVGKEKNSELLQIPCYLVQRMYRLFFPFLMRALWGTVEGHKGTRMHWRRHRGRLTKLLSENGLVPSIKVLKRHEEDQQAWWAALLCLVYSIWMSHRCMLCYVSCLFHMKKAESQECRNNSWNGYFYCN